MADDNFEGTTRETPEDYPPGEFDLAIVGMAGRFPGASNLAEFWANLVNGVECISRFSDDEVLAAGIDPAVSSQPHYVKAGGVLENAEWFDARFFGFYPREAEIMDPQHRVFLEMAWHALEDAGYDPGTYERAIGLYAGCGMNTYLVYNLVQNRDIRENVQGYQLTIANDKDYLPTRVAYKLNLRGPAVNVQTACSTSLVATHLACQALLNRDCDMALAGGVTIRLPQRGGYLYQEGGIASPDGHCRAFDAEAAGTVGGNGAGIVVLKRLADAVADGDTIHAVIKGTAINNDGSNKVGYTAPSVEGQTEVIAAAHAVAGIDPRRLSYIEAHGTGTALGDPIEITALTNAFGQTGEETQWCAIGSLKTNVGHLDAAAGVAGLIKTTLALENRVIPPSLNYSSPNPRIDFARSPFYVNTELSRWQSDGEPRRAAVSSFGIGGTNAHVVLEEAPRLGPSGPSRAAQLLVLSAKTEDVLESATRNLAVFFNNRPDANLADVAYTLKVGREPFGYRRAVVVGNAAEAVQALSVEAAGKLRDNGGEARARSVAFMFTGQGSQYPQMGLGLYKTEPVFRAALDRCADLLRPHLGTDIRGLLYPQSAESPDEAAEKLRQTALTQPALFVIEYALSQLWLSWGIRPDAMIGHSIGEYVAAHLAGVVSLEDALMIVAARGRLMGSLPSGSMLSLPVSEEAARHLMWGYAELAVATINAPEMVVVAGPHEAVDRLESELAARGVAARRLRTSHAFHSAMMDPILAAFTEVVRRARLQPPEIPYVSNLTGTWIAAEEATDPDYYARHLRSAVRFADGLAALSSEPDRALLEVGPGRTLVSLVKANPATGRERAVVASLRQPSDQSDDEEFALDALGQLWLSGIVPAWDADEQRNGAPWRGFYRGERRRRIPLPLYPFQRERYWVEPNEKFGAANASQPARVTKTGDVGQWFYAPSWRRVPAPLRADTAGRKVLFFWEAPAPSDKALDAEQMEGIAAGVAARTGVRPMIITPGNRFGQTMAGFTIRPWALEDYETLFTRLREDGTLPDAVVHWWSMNNARDFEGATVRGFDSVAALALGWSRAAAERPLSLTVVTAELFDVTGGEVVQPRFAPVLGACRVIGQEYRNISVSTIDLRGGDAGGVPALVDQLLAPAPSQATLALRGRSWWAQAFEPLPTQPMPARLRAHGVYLITGGLGRIALVLARHLAERVRARLVLVDRIGLPPREDWQRLLGEGESQKTGELASGDEARLRRVREVLALEGAGAEVMVLQADVADWDQADAAVAATYKRFGALHGVIHAAGTVGQAAVRSIAETDRTVRQAQFEPKISGALALDHALSPQGLACPGTGCDVDFVILMSSVSTVLGGLGFAAYAAANSFLDATGVAQANEGRPWLSVAWDGWAFAEERAISAAAGSQALAITPEEGLQIFERALSVLDLGWVVVSTADLAARLARTVAAGGGDGGKPSELQRGAEASGTAANKHARPKLRTDYARPTNEVEAAIVADWENVLGISPIGIHDDFFELGGHSLLATQLISRLRDAYHVELPLRNLFETPTAAGLAALILRARAETGTPGGEPRAISAREAIRPVTRQGGLPLSFGQERLWFLDQLAPGSPLYNNFAALRLTATTPSAALQPVRLEWALNQVVARHEILRTVFGERDGKATQTVLTEMQLSVAVVDLGDLPREVLEKKVKELALEEARTPFDLGAGPLLRATLLRTRDGASDVLFFTMHHIVSDGWSVGVLIREVTGLYEQYAVPTVLPALPIQYVDYAAWQREWLSGARREEQLAYWRGRLTPAPEPLDLPTDRPRPAVQTANGANYWFTIGEETYRKLEALAKGEGATLFMALLGGLQTLLYRYTGQEDICVGTPVANRDRGETEGLIGFLLNTLVLRTDLSGHDGSEALTFRQLLRRVREVALGAYAHQDLPFETLVEALQPARDMSRPPFFQVMFDLQAAPLAGLALPGVTLSPVKIDGGTAKFDLALSLEYGATTLGGYLNYNTDLFDPETIAAMVEHFRILLADAVSRPDAALYELSLMSPAEEHTLLVEWNRVPERPDHAKPDTVVRMFEAQAALRPLQPAVVMADGSGATLSYAALSERANQMARCLGESGIGLASGGSDQIVALLLHRSVDMVAAIWAVLKAGAGFLPIDPDNPRERIAFLLRDSGAAALISDGPIELDDLPEHMFRIDVDAARFAGQPSRNLNLPVRDSDLAYVIYTSGSTGQPKGVLIEHGGLAQHIIDVTARFGLVAEDHILQFAAYTFDQGLEQVLTALTVGGTLVMRGDEIWPPADFPQVVRDYGLNVINLPPAYWNQVLHEWVAGTGGNKLELPKGQLRTIISGGDVLTPESLRLWKSTSAADSRLINAYGPTETTVTACAFDAAPDWFARTTRPVPIGKPLPHRVAYVVDRHGKPTPIGVPGELWLGGNGVARGYLRRPELTAEKFIDDPFSKQGSRAEGGRVYRTGDLVRRRRDGNLEFLGRIDQQVKVRGFRIELGEIEAALLNSQGVEQAAVIAQGEGTDKRLVAYFVPSGDSAPESRVLRATLDEKLPAYMVPSAFVAVPQLPVNASGKVDRRALQTLDVSEPDTITAGDEYVRPGTAIEAEIAAVWAEVLRIPRVGIHDNFFDLGGHSLLATQIVSRLRTHYPVELPLRRLFEAPTVAGLARMIEEALIENALAKQSEDELAALLAELDGLTEEEARGLSDLNAGKSTGQV